MPTQTDIAKHLGLSLKGTRNMLSKLELDNKNMTMDQVRIAYISNLNKVSLQRSGHLDIANERLKLMDAQRRKTRLETKKIRTELKDKSTGNMKINDDDKTKMSDFIEETQKQMMNLFSLFREPSEKGVCQNKECRNYNPQWYLSKQ